MRRINPKSEARNPNQAPNPKIAFSITIELTLKLQFFVF
jgi:hypothetical protein